MSDQKKSVFITKAMLEGYRSIQHAEVELSAGLNIIIGKNGSGKTNVLNFLYPFVSGRFDNEIRFAKGIIRLQGVKDYIVSIEPVADIFGTHEEPEPYFALQISGKPVNFSEYEETRQIADWFEVFTKIEQQEQTLIGSEFVRHGLASTLGLWTEPLHSSIKLKVKGKIHPQEIGRLLAFGLKDFYGNNFIRSFRAIFSESKAPIQSSTFKDALIEKTNELSKRLAEVLKGYSPISDVRLSQDTVVSYSEQSNEMSIRNLTFEFYSENSWKSFAHLSDGTKRIVFMLSELSNHSFTSDISAVSKIHFIEEPELGIHPHQLHLLMSFLKEQSIDQQIIITTHSPQVLDILGIDELDKIILCEHDSEKGTQLRHMTDEEKETATKYMEKMYLSDFWRYTDFNDK
ncbi:MAG: AAA family ATPase [Bacteroidota bacterium]|nr:AAA family ATPase [Bacteroidota bacterium]